MNKKFVFGIIILFFLNSFFCRKESESGPLPAESRQLILVLSSSFDTPDAVLYRFGKEGPDVKWQQAGREVHAIVGKNGLGWGIGLHGSQKLEGPAKREGDGKSPAGIFYLGSAFGYAPEDSMHALKIPYIHIRELVECIDDPDSRYYNRVVYRNDVDTVDWNSSERMWRGKIWYEQGVVVEHNMNPSRPGAGSCIFLHNWAGEDDSTSGCTAMDPRDMREIIYWLDASMNPVLVQLPRAEYLNLRDIWNLPEVSSERTRHQ